jgi:hypothetical protein
LSHWREHPKLPTVYTIHSKSCFISFYSIKVRNSNQNRVSGSHSTLAILSSLAGNDPGWSGRGGGCSGADCRVVSVMCAARPSTTVFELYLLFTVHLSSCYYSNYCISFCLFCFIMKNGTPPPPAPPLARAPPNKSIPDHLWCNMQILNNPRENSSLLSVEILQESNKIWNICSKILEIIFNALSNETITYFCRHCPLSKVVWH